MKVSVRWVVDGRRLPAGISWQDKITLLRAKMTERKVTWFVATALDEIACTGDVFFFFFLSGQISVITSAEQVITRPRLSVRSLDWQQKWNIRTTFLWDSYEIWWMKEQLIRIWWQSRSSKCEAVRVDFHCWRKLENVVEDFFDPLKTFLP